MEAIAEINDLACHAIESGQYQTALDVLNCCLGCVKQLKKCRASVADECHSHSHECNSDSNSDSNKNIADQRLKATEETVVRLLKGAKRRLLKRKVLPRESAATKRPWKRRRRSVQDIHRTPGEQVDSTTSTVDVIPSPELNKTPSPKNYSCVKNFEHEEQKYFVYCKPLRMTKFQWSRIAECQAQQESGREEKQQGRIDREAELAISANLIFNIALSHHLIATTKGTQAVNKNHHHKPSQFCPRRRNDQLQYSTDSSSDEESDCDDNDTASGYESYSSHDTSTFADTLHTKQRLKGALRLYELGFRVHTKRVAFVTSSRTVVSGSSSPQAFLYPSSSSSTPSLQLPPAVPTTAEATARRVSLPPESTASASARALRPPSSSESTDRDDELKSTTRFALALLNNCAHIHESLGQHDKAKVFQKRLLSFLLVIVDSGESIHDIIGDDPAVDGYLKNVFAGTVFHKDQAPAAVA